MIEKSDCMLMLRQYVSNSVKYQEDRNIKIKQHEPDEASKCNDAEQSLSEYRTRLINK